MALIIYEKENVQIKAEEGSPLAKQLESEKYQIVQPKADAAKSTTAAKK